MAISGISFNITNYTTTNVYTQPEYGSFFVFGYANILYAFPNGFNWESLSQSEQTALSAFVLGYQLWNFGEQIGTTTKNFAQINQKIALNWVKEDGVLTFSADTNYSVDSGNVPSAYLFPFVGFDSNYKLEGVGLGLYLDQQFSTDVSNVLLATKTGTSSLKLTWQYQNSDAGNFTTLNGLDTIRFTKSSTWGNGYTIPLSWTEGAGSLSGFQNFAWANGNQNFTLGWTARANSDLDNEVSFSDSIVSNSGISQFFDTASGAFEAVSSVLSTQLIPGLSIGTLIAIPLCFSVVLFLIKVVKGD